jgi:hypothetical protein
LKGFCDICFYVLMKEKLETMVTFPGCQGGWLAKQLCWTNTGKKVRRDRLKALFLYGTTPALS